MGTFLKSAKDKAAKGEGWDINCAQETMVNNDWHHKGPQGLVAIFLLFIIFHIMYDYIIKGANDEKIKI